MSFSPRVLHVIPSISPRRGGPSEAILPMVRALNAGGVRTEILTTDDDGFGTSNAPLRRPTLVQDVSVRFFHRFSPPIRSVREYAYAVGYGSWLRKQLPRYDLIHVHSLFSYVSTSAMHLAMGAGVPYVVRPLGQLGRWPLRQSAWRKRLYLTMGEAAHLRAASAVHFTSQTEEDEAAHLGLSLRGKVIPHGIALPQPIPHAKEKLRAKLGFKSTQKLLLFLGRLHPKKGLDLLLAALGTLKDICLLLAGEGEAAFERELASLIRERGLAARVVRVGFVTGKAKQLLLQGADVFVLTSHHENFGMAVLESLAAGTPVLVSEQVALARDVANFRLGKVVPLKVEAMRNKLELLLNNSTAWDRERLRKFVTDHYSWHACAASLTALYSSIIEGAPGRR